MKKFNPGIFFRGEIALWAIFFFLSIISVMEVFSAGSTLSYKSGDFTAPLVNQVMYLSAGALFAVFIHSIPCRQYRVIPALGSIIVGGTLWITLFFGSTINGGARWINLFGFQLQPSEFIKPVIISTIALILTRRSTKEGIKDKTFLGLAVYLGIILLPILLENLSTAVLIGLVAFCMMVVGRFSWVTIGKLIGVMVVVLGLGYAAINAIPDSALSSTGMLHRAATWKSRISSHGSDSVLTPMSVDLDKDGQKSYAKIAIASSNIIGKMPGNSKQRDFLSQAYSDFIYAIIIEEMGLEGAVFVLLLYISLLLIAFRISGRCENSFPAFLIIGLSLMIVLQAMVNMAVAVGLMPVTGQTLPLISRGGSSIITTSIMFGMMLSVSRYARRINDKKAIARMTDEQREALERENDFTQVEDPR